MIISESEFGKEYCILENRSGKKWLFDINTVKTGLCLFQASSNNGRLIKRFLQLLSNKKIIRYVLKSKLYLINYAWDEEIKKIFRCKDVYYSVFLGTPGVHCKTVIQISSKKHIFGYCKLTKSDKIFSLFEQEYELLNYLNEVEIKDIPVPIYVKKIEDEYLFCQTTQKTINSVTPKSYNQLTNDFLHRIFFRTSKNIIYNDSILYNNIHNLVFGPEIEQFEKKYLYYVSLFDNELENKKIDMCVAHRDFTPWNMFVDNDKLYVFDWEYGSKEYLPMMDMFHFEIQQKIMDEGLESQEIIGYLEKNWNLYVKNIQKVTELNPYVILCAYLLDFIALYVSRNDFLSEDECKSIEYRFDLLEYVEKEFFIQ